MATKGVHALLERCDPVHLGLYGEGAEPNEVGEADVIVPHLVEGRRIQKILGRQLCVLDDMMGLLERLGSPDQLLNEPCPPNPGSESYSQWKGLKEQYREGLQEVGTLISVLQSRMEQLSLKRDRLTLLVQTLEEKREQSHQLQLCLQTAHNALHVCEGQLTQMRLETEAVVRRLGNWELYRDELQACVSATQGVMQYRLLSVSQSEMCVEMRPRPCGGSSPSGHLEPLKLAVSWSAEENFSLQVYQGTAGMLEESVEGRLSELSAALLEVMQRYTSQGEMLAEIQSLHSRFAIDWRPAERQLVFLKSASVVCKLGVEEGYPSRGRASLISVRTDLGPVDNQHLQLLKDSPSLTEWLEFLSCSPLI